ncbi:GNAT family N-acetyltransferase [Clostridium tagluense]|uniref:GNAT family N-acetyltransferase n=1 Tax=Clostridium tagluense TaxID=360422 RepID=UPI001C0CFABE|nr:GNAT family N-acetyltransferase [Clostridium tagluense]MBU3128058.1 GNAT family N-acetyltransferase [Clostridium tagluense]
MNINFKKYEANDFLRVRDFLVDTFKTIGKGRNWRIERWNFSKSMARIMNEVSIEKWESTIGIWEQNRKIISVVSSEGEGSGEAFFHIGMKEFPQEILEEMFEFTEGNLTLEKDKKSIVQLRIPEGYKQGEDLALSRKYIRTQSYETTSSFHIDGTVDLNLPKGFSIKNGHEVSDMEKGKAHARAFGYVNTNYENISPLGYEALRQTPNYRVDLDLYVVSEANEIAAFCTMWYDNINKIGILEPVGTIPEFRKIGLGRNVIREATNRIAKEGAERVYVGSDQKFYLAIGFKAEYKNNIWEKSVLL